MFIHLLQLAARRNRAHRVRSRLHRALEGGWPGDTVVANHTPSRPLPGRPPAAGNLLEPRSLDHRQGALGPLGPMGGAGLGGLGGFLLALLWLGNPWFASVGGLLGLVSPLWLARQTRRKRLARLDDQLEDWLQMMSNGLRGGQSWMEALEMAARDMESPLAEELAWLLVQKYRGASWEAAYQNLRQRVPSPNLELILAALQNQPEMGPNLEKLLNQILPLIQERVQLQRKRRTLSQQGMLASLMVIGTPLGAALLLDWMDWVSVAAWWASGPNRFLLGAFLLLLVGSGLYLKELVATDY